MNIQPARIYMQEYSYSLPQDRIAEHPLDRRDESKLLVYRNGIIEEDVFNQLANYLPAPATLVLNNTKVIEARMFFQKPTGGIIEIFCLEPESPDADTTAALAQKGAASWQCLIGGASKWKPGQVLQKDITIRDITVRLNARYGEKKQDCFVIGFSWEPAHFSFADILHAAGAVPLPPYIKRSAEAGDTQRYQTIFARHQGSVAAPTASLHFTDHVFQTLAQRDIHPQYLTLHVGAGTFQPVKSETIAGHAMHAEHFAVHRDTLRALQQARPIVAAGTTSLRTLESLYWIGIKLINAPALSPGELTLQQWEAYELDTDGASYTDSLEAILEHMERHGLEELHCRTRLLIVPGYRFRTATALITNFHQPQSTLLLLVAAFTGEKWKNVYDYALTHNFRFLSYGDSSLLYRTSNEIG